MVLARLLAAYRRLGFLVWLSLGSSLFAALLQHASRLPSNYTWFEPIRTLRSVLRLPGFPAAVVAAYALGAWAWRGTWDFEASARSLARALPARELLSRALRPLLGIAAVIAVDALVLGSDRGVLDWLALVAIGFGVAGYRPSKAELARELGYALVSATVFLLICYCYTVLKALTFSSDRRFDAAIVGLESALFGAPPHRALASWTAAHPAFAQLFDWVYFRFFEHMALTTVVLVALRRRAQRTEYLGALALCYVIGGPLYHLFPAFGPSYFEAGYFEFLKNPELLTGTIRQYLEINTEQVSNGTARELRTWGYIACMPSLHVAHELVMLYYVRNFRPAFLLSLLFALLTMVSVVALGWHYPLDSLLGALVAAVAIALARSQSRVLMPRALFSHDDVPPPGKPVIVPFVRAYLAARRQGASPDR